MDRLIELKKQVIDKYGYNFTIVPMLLDANPTRGLKFALYNHEKLLIVTEDGEVQWQRKIEGIIDVAIKVINNSSHENQLEVTLSNYHKQLYSHTGRLLSIPNYEILDERYYQYINSGIKGFNHYDYENPTPLLYSKELERGYYQLNIEVEAELDEIKLFNQDGLCLYFGKPGHIVKQVVLYKNELLELRSRDELINIKVEIQKVSSKPVIHFIGDSTLANQSRLPLYGWAQLHSNYSPLIVNNLAYSARSLKSFCFEGRFNKLLNCIKAGDIVVIGFGHNDARETFFGSTPVEFEDYLNYYIDHLEHVGARVIVTVPIAQRHYDQHSRLINTHEQFEQVILNLKRDVEVVNLNKKLMYEIEQRGYEQSKVLFNNHADMEMRDNTHLSFYGAKLVNEIFIKESRIYE